MFDFIPKVKSVITICLDQSSAADGLAKRNIIFKGLKMDSSDSVKPKGEQKEMEMSAACQKAFFPINVWDKELTRQKYDDDREMGLQSIQDSNFTVSGFINTMDLARFGELGLQFFVFGIDETTSFDEWKQWWSEAPTDEEIDNRIRTLVDLAASYSAAVFGFFLHDEPGASLFPVLGKAVACLRRYAPDKKAYINLFPNYATGKQLSGSDEEITYQEYLDRFVEQVEPGPGEPDTPSGHSGFLSYDNYAVERSEDMMRYASAAGYYLNLQQIRDVARHHHIPFWCILSSNKIYPGSHKTIPSPANMSFQAYTALAAGARGITWFNFLSPNIYAPLNPTGHKTLTWCYVQEINRQLQIIGPIMSRLKSTGVYCNDSPEAPFPNLPGRLVESIDADAPLMVGEFESESEPENGQSGYAMVVNLSLEQSVAFQIAPQTSGPIDIISAADGQRLPFPQEGYWLVAGQGVLLQLGQAGS